jgi:hypothetical protein
MAFVYPTELRQGASLIDSMEMFRRQHGRLPTEAEADPMLRPFQPHRPDGCPAIASTRLGSTSSGFLPLK